jgi:alpha-amylase/alpha-mannosidase (GH57 family)
MASALVIHAHLYQPPREDPRTGDYPVEPGAAPYHDWNEKIAVECYRPIAPLLERMSFNVGSTLFEWLDAKAPDISKAFVDADRASIARQGFGSAIAMPYHHIILPLASRRDKTIEVQWGIRDFQRRYGRTPEGLWLPETAMDLETLDVLAEAGIRFTVLAPHQVEIQPPFGQPATVRTSAKHRIAVFVYDGALSHEVAFGALLKDPRDWLARLALPTHDIGAPICVDVAADGETFGHHHKTGITVLQSVLDGWAATGLEATNYSTFLARHPPRTFARVVERTSWSCPHGIERWRSNCGCRLVAGTSQEWRTPLREGFDWLRDRVDEYLAARGISVPNDPHEAATTVPIDWHARRMFSSCGWFFDSIDGVEGRLCLAHARRACELGGPQGGDWKAVLGTRFGLKLDE